MTKTVTTADGRTLAFCEWGDPSGTPVFSLHGTPGSRLGRHPDEDIYRRTSVRLITYDRPGYGESTRHPGRIVADAAPDVATIADELGLTSFAVMGGSGGGPHSLACGVLLGDRVTRCACIVGVAPMGPGGLTREEWLEGMVHGNVQETNWALAGEETLRRELQNLRPEIIASLESDSSDPLGEDYALSSEDLAVLSHGGHREMMAKSTREAIGRSLDGWVDDDLVITRPWGFDPSQIRVPVTVAYGPDDTLVPASHGKWLSQAIPDARVVVLPGGHFAVYDTLPELLAWLTDGVTA